MSDSIKNYLSAGDAAKEIGIEYSTLMVRVRKGKIQSHKVGWSTLIHKDEVKRAKKVEENKNAAAHKNMERPAR